LVKRVYSNRLPLLPLLLLHLLLQLQLMLMWEV
jgi:hypothetical protein